MVSHPFSVSHNLGLTYGTSAKPRGVVRILDVIGREMSEVRPKSSFGVAGVSSAQHYRLLGFSLLVSSQQKKVRRQRDVRGLHGIQARFLGMANLLFMEN